MTDKQRLEKLVRAETALKQTKAGYTPSGPWWQKGMPLLWEVRMSLGSSPDGAALAEAHGLLKKTEKGFDPRAPRWKEAMAKIDRVEANLSKPPVPNLGPVIYSSKPILLEAPTHETSGLYRATGSHYPAFDFGWIAGLEVLAPEDMVVTRQSSAMGADACYLTGASGLKYWLGHIVRAPADGVRFEKGKVISRIALIPGADHGHLGIDARSLIGQDLKWGRNGNGPDYTFGSPTIGAQLSRGLGV